jgi:ABC-type transport system involved in multi-copper enzyme maturation permease subunit
MMSDTTAMVIGLGFFFLFTVGFQVILWATFREDK